MPYILLILVNMVPASQTAAEYRHLTASLLESRVLTAGAAESIDSPVLRAGPMCAAAASNDRKTIPSVTPNSITKRKLLVLAEILEHSVTWTMAAEAYRINQ